MSMITISCNFQESRIQVVVPELIATNVQQRIYLGEVHVLSSFVVEYYKKEQTYKCINFDKFILLTQETEIQQIPDVQESIKDNAFDFYNLHQMKSLASFDIFLTSKHSNLLSSVFHIFQPKCYLLHLYFRCRGSLEH